MSFTSRLTGGVLAAALVFALVPAAGADAAAGVPLRPAVRDQADPSPSVVLRGRGWGHSVGLSQYGAYAQSRAGRSHAQILAGYYPGTSLGTFTGTGEDQRITVTQLGGTPATQVVRAVNGPLQWRRCSGGSCESFTAGLQPAGARWQLIGGGSAATSRITLCRVAQTGTAPACPAGDIVYQGSGQLQVQLSSRDSVPDNHRQRARAEIASRQYVFGWLNVESVSGRVSIANTLPLEGYLRGLGEVPSSWGGASGGQAALVAQAIIARTYVLGRGRTTCATAACQVFVGYTKELEPTGGNWVAAVREPANAVLRHGSAYAQTFYSSSHGGRTEASQDSWAYGGAVPYLVSVDDPWSLDAANPMRSWTAVATNAEFRRVTGLGLSRVERVQVTSRTAGGSPRTLRVTGPEGARDFTTTTPAAVSRSCNRNGYAGNSLRCDLATTVRNAAGEPFAAAGGRPPSSQILTLGFAPFTDDDGGAHEYATVWANAAGIANGTSATTFNPRADVNRAQMASFIYRTFDVPRRTDRPFRDVSGGEHADAIASVAAAGIAEGYADGTFRPSAKVTREQMASFLARAMGLSPVRPSFADVDPDGTHGGNVGAIAARGVTTGCRADLYCPRDPVKRDQMTSFLHRAVRSLR